MLRKLISSMRQSLRAAGKSNAEVFDEIYRAKGWRGPGEISSGLGSQPENSRPYEDCVVDYAVSHGISSIVDIGCGDFQVSGRILQRLSPQVTYVGLDVSRVAIEHNRRKFESERVSFAQADAAEDPIPPADLVLVREVLQHISTADILKVLHKLESFPHVLVSNTERVGATRRNIDIAPGSASRAGLGSGLWLDLPPFDYEVEELLRVSHKDHPTQIVTVRLKGRQASG
jgi:SAM-dependent methyltransferase